MKVQFEDQLTQKDERIGGLEERFEGVEDQLRQRDLVINHLMYVANRMDPLGLYNHTDFGTNGAQN